MSENNIQEQPVKVEIKPTPQRVDKGIYQVETVQFSGKGDMKGFAYCTPVYKTETDEQVNASYRAINEKLGARTIVNLINGCFRSSLAIKARYALPKVKEEENDTVETLKQKEIANTEAIEKLRKNAPLLVSEEEAEKFVPGVRGELSIQGLLLKASRLYSEGSAFMAEGKKTEAFAKFAEASVLTEQATEKAKMLSPEATSTEVETEENEEETETEEVTQ